MGEKRVGLAVTDSGRRVATVVGSLPRQPFRAIKEAVLEWQTQGVTGLVIGFPLNMDGTEGPACTAARSVASQLEKDTGLLVLLWDERLTSHAAEQAFFTQREGRQTRGSKKDSVGKIDAMAAVMMLQGVVNRIQKSEVRD